MYNDCAVEMEPEYVGNHEDLGSDLIWTAALSINHGLMRAIHLPALAFNKIEEDWRPSRS